MRPLTRFAFAAGAAAALIALTFVLPAFTSYQLATVCAYACAVAGLTLLTGAGGQLSLGQAALMAAGAYSYGLTANALAEAGLEGPALLLLPLAAAVAGSAALGFLVGLAGARLHGPYLAGVTMALVVALPAVAGTFSGVLGGEQGLWITVEKRPTALRGVVGNEQWQAWLAILCAVVVFWLLANLLGGRFGRSLRAVRDNETAAALAGISPARTKVTAFVISSAAAGTGGGLLAYITSSASPGAYSLVFSLFLLMAAVVGGHGSLSGAVWGALLLVALPHLISSLTSSLSLPTAVAQRLDGNLSVAIFGLVLILVIILAPRGIAGIVASWRLSTRWTSRPSARRSGAGRPNPSGREGAAGASAPPAPSAHKAPQHDAASHDPEHLPATPKGS